MPPIAIALSGRWKADPLAALPVDPEEVDAIQPTVLLVLVTFWLATATAGTPYPAVDDGVEEYCIKHPGVEATAGCCRC